MMDLALLERGIAEAPPEDLPALVGDLARLQSLAALRIAAPALRNPESVASEPPDRLLSVKEVADRLGRSTSWVYRHKPELPFYRSLPGGRGGFSEAGLNRYLKRR